MDRLDIRRLHARYRLTPALAPTRDRLDRVLAQMASSGLDEALADIPTVPGEEVCVQSVDVAVRLQLAFSDQRLSADWGDQVVQALRGAIERGGPGIVRYRSRGDAYVDLAISVVRGSRERAWAWRQLGIWTMSDDSEPAEALRAVVRALSSEPATIVPALRAMARAGSLLSFLRGVGDEGVLALAAAAVVALEVPPAVIGSIEATPDRASAFDLRWTRDRVDAILADSMLAPALVAAGRAMSWRGRRAMAVIAILDQDPGIVQAPARAAELIEAVAGRIGVGFEDPPGAGRGDPRVHAEGPQPPASATPDGHESATGAEAPHERAADEAPPTRRGRTEAAGLLLVLHIVGDLRLASELARTPRTAGRAVRWWLHQVGMRLAVAPSDDPAVLAFVGLAPGERPPSAREPEPTEAERRIIARLAMRISLALARRLDRRDALPRTLLDLVCRRPGEVIAHSGWLDVRMPLGAVDLDIRRAGLDLDPGFVPWLGVVVRFIYD